MGTLIGHAFPGLIFYFSAMWHVFNIFRTLVSGGEFRHQFWYNAPCCTTAKPIEPFIKIFLCTCGIIIEMGHSARWSIHDAEGNFINMNDFQHATMYTAFLLAAAIDIILSRGSKLSGLDGLAYCIAFAAEGLMFYFHLHERSKVDTQLHILLVLSCFLSAVTTALARWKSTNPVLSLTCSLSIMVHGTWFMNAGFILYPPGKSEPNIDMSQMGAVMYITDLYVIHYMTHLAVMLLCYFLVKVLTGTSRKTTHIGRKQLIKQTDSDLEMYNTVRRQYSQRKYYPDSD